MVDNILLYSYNPTISHSSILCTIDISALSGTMCFKYSYHQKLFQILHICMSTCICHNCFVNCNISDQRQNKSFGIWNKCLQWCAGSLWQKLRINNITWWRHQMEFFFALLAICAGNLPVHHKYLKIKQYCLCWISCWYINKLQPNNVIKVANNRCPAHNGLRHFCNNYVVFMPIKNSLWTLKEHN